MIDDLCSSLLRALFQFLYLYYPEGIPHDVIRPSHQLVDQNVPCLLRKFVEEFCDRVRVCFVFPFVPPSFLNQPSQHVKLTRPLPQWGHHPS